MEWRHRLISIRLLEYFKFFKILKSRRGFVQNLICKKLRLLTPNTVRLYHERVMMKIVGLSCSAIFICARIFVTDLFHYLA